MPRAAPAIRAATYKTVLAEGRSLRQTVPRSSLALWKPPPRRADPVALLESTGRNRLVHLLPLRYGRMSQSAFAYMRGAAAMIAADVAATPLTGIQVQACGDCHLGNFGAFASPERRVLFDITDFDETFPASWEHDVKRLATSFVLLGREHGDDRKATRDAAAAMLRSYRTRLLEFAHLSPLETWYALIDSELLIRTAPDPATRRRRERFEAKARARTGESLVGRLVEPASGAFRLLDQAPVITHLEPGSPLETSFRTALERYPATVAEDRRTLLSHYRLIDVAFKVVGVGSVGTRCGIGLYVSASGHLLVLQVKEALASVLALHGAKGRHAHQGQRVVVGQRLMQCASDIFLGWASDDDGHEYYVRQLRDMKTSVPLEELRGGVLENFAEMCGWALARAHAKGGDAARISGYLGGSERADEAVAQFALAYADQCEKDYAKFMRAIKRGKIPVEIETR